MLLKEREEGELESITLSEDDKDVMAVGLLPKDNIETKERNKVFQFMVSNSARVFGGIRLISQGSYTGSGIYQPGGIKWNVQRLTGGVISLVGTSFVLVRGQSQMGDLELPEVKFPDIICPDMSKVPFLCRPFIDFLDTLMLCHPDVRDAWKKFWDTHGPFLKKMTQRCFIPHKFPRSFFALTELATSSLYFISGINTGRSVEVISSVSNLVAILLIAYTPDTDVAWLRYNLYRSITGIPVQVPNAIQSYMFEDYLSFFAIVLGLTNFLIGTCLNGVRVADKLPGRPFKEQCIMVLTGKIPKNTLVVQLERNETEEQQR